MGLGATTYLSKTDVQELLGLSSFGMWRLPRQHPDFPAPDDEPRLPRFAPEPDGPLWDGTELVLWAARTPAFQHRGALLERPIPSQRQAGWWLGHSDTPHGPATDWHTAIGTIRMLHTEAAGAATAAAADLAAAGERDVVTVCALYGDLGITGPSLVAADTARPTIAYEAAWGTVVALAGQSLPWWPVQLRRPEVIRQWQPGAPAVVADVVPDDREKVLRRAAGNTGFSEAARAAMTGMANEIHNDRVDDVVTQIRIFGEDRDLPLVIAARHNAGTHPMESIDDDAVLARAWSEITASTLPDAVAATDVALGYHARLLPFGRFTEVRDRPGTVIAAWTSRLTLCDPTAGHATLAEGKSVDAFFVDPLTDAPVVRTKPEDGETPEWLFYAPRSLPAGRGELAAVVLLDELWITTTDGQIHPAPCTSGDHLWWGDGWGDRPTEASTVIDQLLDNLAAVVSLRDHWSTAPAGLTSLLNEDHKQGTQLSRAALLHARMTPPGSRRHR